MKCRCTLFEASWTLCQFRNNQEKWWFRQKGKDSSANHFFVDNPVLISKNHYLKNLHNLVVNVVLYNILKILNGMVYPF